VTANDILQEIIAMRIAEKSADDALARAPNIAMKAKVSHREEASIEVEE
jgi:hypothetical protein